MLRIKNMSLEFSRYGSKFFKKEPLKIISDFTVSVNPGEIVAIIGSSGSGKSLLAHAVMGILPHNVILTGTMEFKNSALTEKRKKKIRGKEIVLIPQSIHFLDPLRTVGEQVLRAAYLDKKNKKRAAALRDRAFARYRLSDDTKDLYPFQVSGGMARRVLIAAATVTDSDLIIADEPTTGLDYRAIMETLTHLRALADTGKGIVLITHDLGCALHFADTIAVFYGGTTVEIAHPSDFDRGMLRHPYTRELFASLPENDFTHIPGLNPFGNMLSEGCVFEERCRQKRDICKLMKPEKQKLNNGYVWCHNA